MNFINDVITDEDRKRFDFSAIRRAPGFVMPISNPTRWTVDRRAGAFLLWLGDQGHDANDEDWAKKTVTYFSFWWEGINVECKLWWYSHAPNSITWKQDWIDVPDEQIEKKADVYRDLKQALIAYQWDGESRRLRGSTLSPQPAISEICFDF